MSQRIIDRSYVGEVLQHVYSSDVNLNISLIFAGGYFYLELDGSRIPLQGTSVEEAVTHLASYLTEKLPASNFATWWSNNFREYTEQ